MEKQDAQQLLQTMIDYFEAGNQDSDAAAKAILESDFEGREHWRAEAANLRQGTEWSGLRAPEAEIVAAALHHLQQLLTGRESQGSK